MVDHVYNLAHGNLTYKNHHDYKDSGDYSMKMCFKNPKTGAGEMVQQLKTKDTLPEDLDLIPSTHIQLWGIWHLYTDINTG